MAHGNVLIGGFSVLQLKWNDRSKTSHYLYLKEHNVRDTDECKPKQRTLFILNVPPFCSEEQLRRVFSQCGTIMRVYIQSRPAAGAPPVNKSRYFPITTDPEGYKVAYIVYRKESELQKVLKLPYDKPLILTDKDKPPSNVGLRKWCRQYEEDTQMDREALQAEIDKYMADFDNKVQKEAEAAKQAEGVVDDDGWVTVTKTTRKAAPLTEKHQTKLKSKEKQKRKRNELLNFYAFQLRDSKKERIAVLRKKFEEDKQRIAIMKASRKFRPY